LVFAGKDNYLAAFASAGVAVAYPTGAATYSTIAPAGVTGDLAAASSPFGALIHSAISTNSRSGISGANILSSKHPVEKAATNTGKKRGKSSSDDNTTVMGGSDGLPGRLSENGKRAREEHLEESDSGEVTERDSDSLETKMQIPSVISMIALNLPSIP
jgi:hypothetical protein